MVFALVYQMTRVAMQYRERVVLEFVVGIEAEFYSWTTFGCLVLLPMAVGYP